MTFNQFYYLLKPLIPRRLQIELRRMIVARKRARYAGVWPIDERAAVPPEGWAGWPDGKKFALILTHDVETARGHENCRKLMELEEKLGFRSSFGFVPERYDVSPQLRKDLQQRGFEISVHGLFHDGLYYRSRKVFRKRAARINHYLKDWGAVGFRSPSMLHNLDWLHDLKVEYDSSTFDTDPFEPQPDGVGTIFPFWVPQDGKKDGYLELPYTLPQDHSLFVLMKQKDISVWERKLDWIAEKGGMALIITHPDYMHFGAGTMSGEEYPASYYEEFLKYIRERYKNIFWHVLPKDVPKLWNTRLSASVEKHALPALPVSSANFERRKEAKSRLRVGMLVYSFYESDNRVMRYAETLAKRGDQVDVVALRRDGQPFKSKINGVNVYRIQKRVKNEKRQITHLMRLMVFFLKSIGRLGLLQLGKGYHIIHVHNIPDFLAFAAIIPKMLGAKVILDIHDIVPELYGTKFSKGQLGIGFKALLFLERLSCAFSNHVIIANHIWHKTLTKRSVGEQKCSVVLNYPDENIFFRRTKPRDNETFTMIYPGSLNWHQGIDIAIKAFALIKDEIPAVFNIYGEGAHKESLEQLIDGLGLKERVRLLGSLPIREVAEKMAGADLGIEPKRNNAFAGDAMSTKILEFMSLGVPVIVSDTRIHKYYFQEPAVKFFKSETEQELADCMRLLYRNETMRKQLIQKGYEFAESYGWDKRKEEYLNLMDRLAERKS